MKRERKQITVDHSSVAKQCEKLTDDNWMIHTILPTERYAKDQPIRYGNTIIAWRNKVDLSGGVPR